MIKRIVSVFLFTLLMALSAEAISPARVALVIPAYQAPGWTGWAPASLGASIKFWLNADDIAVASPTAWVDRVGSLSLAAEGSPVWSETSFAGKAGVTFATTEGFKIEGIGTLPVSSTPGEIWALLSQDALVADALTRYYFRYGANASGQLRGIERVVVSSINKVRAGNSNTATVPNIVPGDGIMVIGAIFDDTLVSHRINGGTDNSSMVAVPLATGVTRIRIGSSLATTVGVIGWSGKARHTIVTTALAVGPFGVNDKFRMESYLWWDIVRPYMLPYNHPYRNRKP